MNPRPTPTALALGLALVLLGAHGARAQDLRHGVYLPLDDVQILSTGGATVGLEGNAAFAAPDFQVLVELDPQTDRPTSISVGVDLHAALTIEVSANGSGDFEETLRPAPILLPPIPFGGSTVVVPSISLEFTIEGQAEAGMRLSVVQELHASLSATVGQRVAQGMPPPPDSFAQASAPEVSGGSKVGLRASIAATATFLIVYQGFTIGGPSFSTETALQLAVVPAADPWWDLDLHVELGVGVGGPGFGHTDTVWSLTQDIADAGGPFPLDLPLTRWSTAYGLDPYVHAASITPWGEGFALAGRAGGGWFAGLQDDGLPLWEKEGAVVSGGFTDPCELQATLDGGIVSAGEDGTQARVERLDADGNLLWTRRYVDELGGQVRVNSLIARDDGGFVFAGLTGGGFDQQPIVVWLDDQGLVEDAVQLDLGTSEDEAGFQQIIATGDGGWAAVGWAVYEDHPDIGQRTVDGRNGLIVKLDEQHDLVFTRILGGMGWDQLFGITELDDGALMACGEIGSEEHAAWLACLEADGSERWMGTYAGRDNPYGSFVAVSAVAGAGAVAAGTSGIGTDTDSWMVRVDPRGMPVWLKSLAGPDRDELLELRTLDDGLVACGLTHSLDDPLYPGKQAWALRANIDGMLHFDESLGFDAVNEAARWNDTSLAAVVELSATLHDLDAVGEDTVLVLENVSSTITTLAN